MIIGKLHPGSGLGDQLFSYIITRVIALDKGYKFGFVGKEFFKGKDFMNLDWGKEVIAVAYTIQEGTGHLTIQDELYERRLFIFNKPHYDPEVNFIEDGTIIDGWGAQDSRYWGHRLNEINEWLKVTKNTFNPNSFNPEVIINFRGGEYKTVPELFLPKEYWWGAISYVSYDLHESQYVVHTDDPEIAEEFFPKFEIVKDIEKNWNALRNSRDAIISNSAFAIIPRMLAHLDYQNALTVAPKFWAGRNVEEWRRPQNYYSQFKYI